MKRDFVVSGLLGLLALSCLYRPIREPVVVAFWNPVAFSGLIILLALTIYLRMDMTALVLLAFYLYLYNNSQVEYSEDRRVEVEKQTDDARFDSRTSIDIQFADGTVKHKSPSISGWTKDAGPLLTYPPSSDTLKSLSG